MSDMDSYVGDEISLRDVIDPLVARWKLLLIVFLICATIGYGVSKIVPKTYQSTAVIFVQQKSAMSSVLQDLPVAIPGAGSKSSGYLISLLNSQTLLQRVITRLGLGHTPEFSRDNRSSYDLIEKLRERISVLEDKSGCIRVTVKVHNPYLAAKIANGMVDGLDGLVIRSSKRKAEFIEQKMKQTNRELRKAEDKLLEFAQTNDVVAIAEQTNSTVQQMAEIDGEMFTLDVQLADVKSQLQNAGGLDNLVDLSVRKQALESSRNYVSQQRSKLSDKLGQLPSTAANYTRLLRDVTVRTKTYELLSQQYQIARITQQGEDGDFQIIDRATPKLKHVAPRGSAMSFVFGFLGLIIISLLTLSASRKQRDKTQPTSRSSSRPMSPASHA